MRIKFYLFLKVFLISFMMTAQEKTVTGVVTDQGGLPLPGASVIVKGTANGTQTDFDGNYSIKVGNGETLVFSYIGMSTAERLVGTASAINISLEEDAQALEEVVVTALGVERDQHKLGYSVGTVKSEDLVTARDGNVVNSLAGKVSGLNITQSSGTPGGGTNIIIRGASSLSGNNQPIFIVDGIPIDNTTYSPDGITGNVDVGNRAGDLDPETIESISVLKGAAASALYGSRAKNGAIVISTKRGKVGRFQVNINNTIRFNEVLKLPKYQNEYAQGDKGTYDKDNINGWGPKISGQTVEDFAGDQVKLQAYENNVEDFFASGLTRINSVNVSGGSESSDYRLTVSNYDQTGIVPGSSYIRNNFSINAGHNFTDKFSSRVSVEYINSRSNGKTQQGSNDPNVLIPNIIGMSRTLDINKLRNNYVREDGSQIALTNNTNNPYWIINKNQFTSDLDRVIASVTFDYDITDNLKVTERLGTDFYNEDRRKLYAKGTLGQLNGAFTTWDIFSRVLNNDLYLTFNHDINEDLGLTLLAGHNIYQTNWERATIESNDLIVDGLYRYANARSSINTNETKNKRIVGAYVNANLDYKNLLFFEANARNDWSSTLPKENNSYFYYSTSLGFQFTELMANNDLLNFGKLRLSYAEVGSDTDPYQLDFAYQAASDYFVQYSLGGVFPHGNLVGFSSPRVLPNPELKPQRKKEYEIGMDLGFFRNKIKLDVNYYNSKTTDQIVNIDVPLSTGFFAKTLNAGSIKNEGIEVSLGLSPFSGKEFEWDMNFAFSKNKQTVVSLIDGLEEYQLSGGWSGLTIKATPGEEFGLYGTAWKRGPEGAYIINETTGLKEVETNQRLGNINPDWRLGINNSFSYKNFTLGFLVDVKQGGVLYSGTVASLRSSGLAYETLENRGEIFVDSGVNEMVDPVTGDVTYKPNTTEVTTMQDYWSNQSATGNTEGNIFDASYVKLREVSFSYNVPRRFLDKTFIKNLNIGIEGRNLWIIDDNVPHIDPESNFFGSNGIGANVEFNSVPTTRSLGLNIGLTF